MKKELASAKAHTSGGSERSSKGKSKPKRKKPKKKSKSGRTAQPDLPIQPVRHHLKTEGFQCEACGSELGKTVVGASPDVMLQLPTTSVRPKILAPV